MTLTKIHKKIDSIAKSIDNGNYPKAKEELNSLLRMYDVYKKNNRNKADILENVLSSRDYDLTDKEKSSIREQRRILADTSYLRTSFISISQILIENPYNYDDNNYSEIVSDLKSTEEELDKALSESESVLNKISLPPTLLVDEIIPNESPSPYQNLLDIRISLTNVGDDPLDTAVVTLSSGQNTLCSYNINDIGPDESVSKNSKIKIPDAGNREIVVTINDQKFGNVNTSKFSTVKVFGKFSFSESALSDLNSIYDSIDTAEFVPRNTRNRWLTEIKAAIESCSQAKAMAQQNPDGNEAQAESINSELTISESSTMTFFEDYSEYYKVNRDEIPAEFHRTILSLYSVILKRLNKGKDAGLRGSGKSGINKTQESPKCEALNITGRRGDSDRVFESSETIKMIIYIDSVSDQNGTRNFDLYDNYPKSWRIAENFGDVRNASEGTVYLGDISPNDLPESVVYFAEAPEDIEDTGTYSFGPAFVERNNKKIEFAGEYRTVVIGSDTES